MSLIEGFPKAHTAGLNLVDCFLLSVPAVTHFEYGLTAGPAAGVAVHDAADVATCTAIILELLQAPMHMPDTLKSGK